MYKIIGPDGEVHGPLPVEQLRQWVREGVANAQTQVQPEGSLEWKALGTLPEFADLLGGAAPVAGAPPAVPPTPTVPVNPTELAEEILARGYDVDIGSCVSRGWQLFKSDFWIILAACFVANLIASGGGIPYIGPLISLVVGGPMIGGLYVFLLRHIRKQPMQFGDIFLGFSTAFVPLMLAYVVSGLLTGLGMLFCIIPGIYLAVSWMFTLALVTDKKLDFWPAMELSRRVVGRHWWALFAFALVLGLLTLAGVFACCVGVFVTASLSQCSLMYAYEDIFNSPRD